MGEGGGGGMCKISISALFGDYNLEPTNLIMSVQKGLPFEVAVLE